MTMADDPHIEQDLALVTRALDREARGALGRVLVRATEDGARRARAQRPRPRPPARKPRQPTPDGLKTLSEGAAKLGCSLKTLKGHIASGALPYVALGHGSKRQRKMLTDADLDAFIANQTRKDVPACPSIESRVRRIGTSTSTAEVIGFSARRSARLAAKRKP
jgi:hypothetical protein